MTNKIDLHLHSTASDGTMTPSELANYAKENGITVAAITDHDTVDGAEEFLAECGKIGITGIAGVEISADYECEMHVLGLFIDHKNAELNTMLKRLRNARYERNIKMIEKLNNYDIKITEADILALKEGGTLYDMGRAHFAIAMVEKGYVKNKKEAFEKYLGNDADCYVPRFKLSPEMCAGMIQYAGGIAVLAHPFAITHKKRVLDNLLGQIKEWGFDGVEAYHSSHSTTFNSRCLELAPKHGLIVTGGSDFHANNKPDVKIGVVNKGSGTVPYEVYEQITEYMQRRG